MYILKFEFDKHKVKHFRDRYKKYENRMFGKGLVGAHTSKDLRGIITSSETYETNCSCC